jgi:iron complex outermembrane recepter protein
MVFRNEIALTGELSEVGLPLRRNVPSSYRRGLELEATIQATPAIRLRSNANVSRNRISRWLEFRNVEPLLTPSVIISQAFDYTPSPALSAGVIGRYVSRSFLDNTNNESLVTPSFVTFDGNVGYSFTERARLSVQVNNLLNNQRVFASGYAMEGIAYYYPQATRHFVMMVDFRL